MPIKVHNNLPAKKVLEGENIFVMDEGRASQQDIRPLNIAILNLMPLKEMTEVHLLRSLSNTPLQVDITLLTTGSYVGRNTASSHLEKFYLTYDDVKNQSFDGLIITGAPVELMEFEDVTYWKELCEIMEWSKSNVTSTFHICWGAQAGLYYHYGIPKFPLDQKMFGVFGHTVYQRKEPLVRGFDDIFYVPHSRHTTVLAEDVKKHDAITVYADSEEAGVFLMMAENGRQIFVTGHPEYDRNTLDVEYKRDLQKGMDIMMPKNYYPEDDSSKKPRLLWRGHANTLYSNWLNYYVYQVTPYEL